MSELGNYLQDTVSRLFSEQVDRNFLFEHESSGWSQALWQLTVELGIEQVLVPESKGGVGGDWDDAYQVISAVGQYAVPLPIAETIVARWLLSLAGAEQPDGPGTLIVGDACERVPWGRHTGWGLAQSANGESISLLQWSPDDTRFDENLAREPRDTLDVQKLKSAELNVELPDNFLLYLGALIRSAQIAGAGIALVERASQYAEERSQFGRSLSKFQAVQHNIARLASATASVGAMSRSAFNKMNNSVLTDDPADDARLAIASAKYRASDCADLISSIAHQIHGAIGFTHEHDLHFFTRRLWSWRTEFGSAGHWSKTLGELTLRHGSDGIWKKVTAL